MPETTSDKISRFCDVFEDRIHAAETSLSSIDGGLYSRLLFTVILDALAKVTFPSINGVGERFRLIVENSGWDHAARVSMLHLERAIAKDGRSKFKALQAWVTTRRPISLAPPDTPINNDVSIAVDPHLLAVEGHWPRDSQGHFLKLMVSGKSFLPKHFTHSSLFYAFRNHLVHELRVPGNSAELLAQPEPIYQAVFSVSDKCERFVFKSWELMYPLPFLSDRATGALAFTRQELTNQNRSPFSAFQWGSFWLRGFN